MTILDTLVASARLRVERAEQIQSLEQTREYALLTPKGTFSFEQALRNDGLSFICEVKRASPSKGIIAEHFPYLDIAREYESIGADAISVLTEPEFFKGDDVYLSEISSAVKTPTLRKDFIISEYQIYEAKTLGASAILLIAAILGDGQLNKYIEIADSLGISALVETRSESDVFRALDANARIVGVNNRDLKTFDVDIHSAEKLRALVPSEVIFVTESGISSPDDIESLSSSKPDAVLIGEALMKAVDRGRFLEQLREASQW
jgi:indole-3-glycerol phosphate synthase